MCAFRMESRPMNDNEVNRSMIDRDKLPPLFPTHRHSPEFWEQLGRTIATYGFLEEVLGKAIFAFTATRSYSPDEIDAALQAWLPQLERALTDQLCNLVKSYGKATHDNPATTTQNIDELVEYIKEAAKIRNILCHGSWHTPNADGASVPLFFNRQKQVFDTAICQRFVRSASNLEYRACGYLDLSRGANGIHHKVTLTFLSNFPQTTCLLINCSGSMLA